MSVFDLDPCTPNLMPSRYGQVSVATVPSLSPDDLVEWFTGREAYRKTRFVVARLQDDPDRCALVELARDNSGALFSVAVAARVLAEARDCVYVRDNRADVGVASHLARVAATHPMSRCVIVEGRYRHVGFLLNADPVLVTVTDIVPPSPSKLADQVARVLDTAEELPPVLVNEQIIDSRSLLSEAEPPLSEGLVVPCQGGDVTIEGVSISHLDQRPARVGATLLGCQRSQQIHRWFYGTDAQHTVDICPRHLIGTAAAHAVTPTRAEAAGVPVSVGGITGSAVVDSGDAEGIPNAVLSDSGNVKGTPRLVLSRCCMLEEGVERRGDTVLVPWGATLAEVRQALGMLTRVEQTQVEDTLWTRT